ncbi:heme lyase CcmF/NrfE family subunit [Desulfomicrobium escambiense]|uniref:heme lyase CcmF/NrfE family subunit n=1 Tax=Desulfomicrobium escambiense TaxID=29503 RepID=UPI00040784EF|nr:cytochrome c-type biogenesis CcmF C-terminal domain-containing protein [Desulfomicrobium escambiense]
MHAISFTALLLSMLAAVGLTAVAGMKALKDDYGTVALFEKGQILLTMVVLGVSVILLQALVVRDFSYVYVRDYTDNLLPMFYAVTAFWAGQNGSFLFWYLCVALMGWCMIYTPGYSHLDNRTKVYFWILFFLVEIFFLFALTGPSNPFTKLDPVPADGHGLNPLLQNPGMIFHPPLLFLGYAGYTIPCCLALASRLSGNGREWLDLCRNWNIVAWIFLTAGIILGAWWSYMELGWGGYWAWDPVENASLIPWLAGTGFVHTAIVGRTRKTLLRTNVFMVALTFLLCFFATFVVRSGMIESLHAFGGSKMGIPLLVFLVAGSALTLYVCLVPRKDDTTAIDDFTSRPGMLFLASWLFLCLAGIVFLGVLWPVISSIWSENPVGLDAGFYNRVCLPLFSVLAFIMSVCPWFSQKSGVSDKLALGLVLGAGAASGAVIFALGYRQPLALLAAVSGIMIAVSVGLVFVRTKGLRSFMPSWGAYGVHLGVAMMVVGVAFSGPYKVEEEAVLTKGQSMTVGAYEVRFDELRHHHDNPAMDMHSAELTVLRDGREVGKLAPEKRLYASFQQSTFAEVSVIPSLGEEIYSTLLGFNEAGEVSLKVSLNPLVNWIWIGGTLSCLIAFLCWRKIERR